MAEHDSQTRLLEDFVRGYFQDLAQDLQQVRDRLDQWQDRLASRLEGIVREPYLQVLSRRFEGLARREAVVSKLATAFRSFAAAPDEKDVLDTLIRCGQEIAPRTLLLVKKGDGWAQFRDGRLEEQAICREDEPTVFQRAAKERTVTADESARFPAHRRLHEQLGGDAAYCVAIPLIFGDSVPAVFYADASDHEHLDVTGLELLCQGARLAIRALRLSQQDAAVEPRPSVAVAAPEIPAESPKPPPQLGDIVSAGDRPGGVSMDFSGEVVSRRGEFNLEEQAIPEKVEAAASDKHFLDHAFKDHVFKEAQVPPATTKPPAPSSLAPPAEAQVVVAPTASRSKEEEHQHADALRFARLLVSELKLYNEQAVAEARRRGDIYSRLKQDIDRSRLMYDRRVSPIVARHRDYFHEEIVKLLAEGDADALGRDYPGSQIHLT